MPIFMDRHEVSETVTAENVAQIHQEDVKIQHKYGCRGLTYWFDEDRKTAFCLIEAPDENAILEMHSQAHGNVPHEVIEVNKTIVESFLGRIEDPVKAQNASLNIINEPAFRTIMSIAVEHHSYHQSVPGDVHACLQQFYRQVEESCTGNFVQQDEEYCLISFKTVTEAVLFASHIRAHYRDFRTRHQMKFTGLSIGLHAGIPVTNKKNLFEDTIQLARRMCYVSASEIVISTEVHQLYERENPGATVDHYIFTLKPTEEKLFGELMEFTEKQWQDAGIKVQDLESALAISKSKLYREMIRLTGKSPNVFLLHFRLRKSLRLLQKQAGTVSEIAFDCGFNSPSYYSRCFRKKYGIMPSAVSA